MAPGLARAEFAVAAGGSVRLGYYYAIDPTCTSIGEPSVGIIQSPQGGRIEVRRGRDYPNFPTTNIRSRCDLRKAPVIQVIYRATPGYRGIDQLVYEVVFPRGQVRRYQRYISVR